MRILFINYEFPPIGGGGGRVSANIAKEIAAYGHDVTLLTSAYGALPREERRDGYLIRRLWTLRRYKDRCRIYEMIAFMLSSIVYILKERRRLKVDISIAFFTLPCAPAAYLLKKLAGVPYLISLQGGDVPGFMRETLWIYHRLSLGVIRHLWRHAEARIANSLGLQRLAKVAASGIPILMVPNAVNNTFFVTADERRSKCKGDMIHLLTVGRFSPQKGLDLLLRAIHRLPVHVALWIVGDGPLRTELETQAATLNIQDRVTFFGWQEEAAVKEFYRKADLFVLSSLDEGMPLVVLEAMAMGLPIVATDVSGTQELVRSGENGYLVPVKDVDALTSTLFQAICNPEALARMSERSRAIAAQYTWPAVAEAYLALVQEAYTHG